MCGRAYSTYTADEMEARYFHRKKRKFPFGIVANYNMAPTHLVPIVRGPSEKESQNEPELAQLRWGLVPFWAKDIKIAYKMINARAETIDEKPAFREAFKKRRCIVPVTGFFEWKRDPETESKRPFRIFLKDQPIMSLAGIWENWKDEKGQTLQTFAIVTTEANGFMSKIHDRMPVILDQAAEEKWLFAPAADAPSLKSLMRPCPDAWLNSVEVSTLVNSPKNNAPEVLEPLDPPR